MDKNEAKLVLQARRPNGQDDLPVFVEALALVESDPELKQWWTAQQAFDRKVAAKLAEIPVPADLRATILAGRKIEQMTQRSRFPYWLAAAATVMILGALGVLFLSPHASAMESREYQASILDFMDHDPSLGLSSSNHQEVLAWLQERHSPTCALSPRMTEVPTLGCQTMNIHGHAVSLICFQLASGEVVHLFVTDRATLANPPDASPMFNQSGNWATAAWSDGGKTYMLATQAPADTLHKLL